MCVAEMLGAARLVRGRWDSMASEVGKAGKSAWGALFPWETGEETGGDGSRTSMQSFAKTQCESVGWQLGNKYISDQLVFKCYFKIFRIKILCLKAYY